jgi:hypothetical protein
MQGASVRTALAVCGWTNPEQLRRARRRAELRQIGGMRRRESPAGKPAGKKGSAYWSGDPSTDGLM